MCCKIPLSQILIIAMIFLKSVDLRLEEHVNKPDVFATMTRRLIEILDTCPSTLINDIVMLTDSNISMNWTQKFFRRVLSIQIKIDGNTYPTLPVYNFPLYPQAFILIASTTNIGRILRSLRSSNLWHSESLFLLMDRNMMEMGCTNAGLFLKKSWTFNIVWSTFVCFESTKGFMLYTINPFTKLAPEPWTEVKSYTNESNDTSWAMYSRKLFHEGRMIRCPDINFEKTKNLGGFTTKVAIFAFADMINSNRTGWEGLSGVDVIITELVFSKLNSTVVVKVFTDYGKYGEVDNCGTSYGIMKNVSAGVFDIQMNSRYIFNKIKTPITYPHMQNEISVITKFTGFQTVPMKLISFLNYQILIAVFLVSFLTVIILNISTKCGLALAFLNIVRIITGSSIKVLPHKNMFKVLLLMITILFLIINTIFQSRLASILTSPIENSNVDDMHALERSSYVVYIYASIENLLNNTSVDGRVKFVTDFECIDKVISTKNAACVGDMFFLVKSRKDHSGLYVSKHVLSTQFSSYPVRPDWPLKDRISYILSLLNESGLIGRWKEEGSRPYIHQWKVYNARSLNNKIRQLKLEDVQFVFKGLFSGLFFSALAFFGELFCSFYKRRTNFKKGTIRPQTVYPFVN